MSRKIIDFLLFTSIFITACAALMAYSTYKLFHFPVDKRLILFVCAGTLCSYNFHWLLTPALYGESKKAKWSYDHRGLHALLFILSLVAAAFFSLQLIYYWYWLALTAFITFLYSAPKIPWGIFKRLKHVAVGKTAFLALAWTHIPFILPLLIGKIEWTPAHYLFVLNRFFLIYPICILFDYRDRESDKKEGIRSLVTQLPEKGVHRLFMGSLMVFFISGICALMYFHIATVVALLLPGILLFFLYNYSKKERSDYLYYFVLDGLMMLSSLVILLI